MATSRLGRRRSDPQRDVVVVQRLRDQLAVPQLLVRVVGRDLDHVRHVPARLVRRVAAAADRDMGPVGSDVMLMNVPMDIRLPGTRRRGTPRRRVQRRPKAADVHAA